MTRTSTSTAPTSTKVWPSSLIEQGTTSLLYLPRSCATTCARRGRAACAPIGSPSPSSSQRRTTSPSGCGPRNALPGLRPVVRSAPPRFALWSRAHCPRPALALPAARRCQRPRRHRLRRRLPVVRPHEEGGGAPMPGHARHLQHPNRRSPLLGAPPVRLAWLSSCSPPPLANSFMCTVGRPSRASRPKRLGPAPCSCFFRGA